jgi:hypothetical protein
MLIAAIVVIAALSILIGLAVGLVFLAVPIFLMGFIGFLLWRAKARADAVLGEDGEARVPTTAEAVADPVDDSSIGDAAASQTSSRTRAP